MKKTFKNLSIFQGFAEYFDNSDQKWRREKTDGDIYRFYKYQHGAFALHRIMRRINKRETLAKMHERMTELENRDE